MPTPTFGYQRKRYGGSPTARALVATPPRPPQLAMTGGAEAVSRPPQRKQPMIPQQVRQTAAAGQQTAAEPYDYDADPILQKIRAMTGMQRQQAEAEALGQRKQVAIDFGDDTYARNVLGDENTARAAAANPHSVRARRKSEYGDLTRALEDDLNKRNLFYSGHRADELTRGANEYQGRLYDAGREQQGILDQIRQGLLAALLGADRQDMEAEEDAAGRAIERGDMPIAPPARTGVATALAGGLTPAQMQRQRRLLEGLL